MPLIIIIRLRLMRLWIIMRRNSIIMFKETHWCLISDLDVRQITIKEEATACLWLKYQCSGFKNSKSIEIKELLTFKTLADSFV